MSNFPDNSRPDPHKQTDVCTHTHTIDVCVCVYTHVKTLWEEEINEETDLMKSFSFR